MSTLRLALLAYLAASLLHFAHNAEYLADYPNLPASLTRGGVYAVWLGVTAIGLLGYVGMKRHRRTGLGVLAVYGALGLGGLDHYVLATPLAHTAMMNFTIWVEVAAAVAVLALVANAYRTAPPA